MNPNRYLPAAQNIVQSFSMLLAEQGLNPFISRYVLAETEQGNAWLFIVMDDSVSQFLESYSDPRVLSHLSAAFHGHRVLFSNSYGLRYAILLNPFNHLPELPVDFQHPHLDGS